jgi:hypothetical protein
VTGPVPNVGGAPGVEAGDVGDGAGPDEGPCVPQPLAASTPKGAVNRNCLRVFMTRVLGIPRVSKRV